MLRQDGPMQLDDVMRTTGAIRAFTDDPVPDDVLWRVFDLARFAPSGGNRQGWHVVVVRDPAVRAAVRAAAEAGWEEYVAFTRAGRVPFGAGEDGRWHGVPDDVDLTATPSDRSFVEGLWAAPVLAVVVADLRQLAVLDVEADRQSIVGGGSIYPFVQNVLLAARAEGLGGVLTTFLARHEDAVRDVLGLAPYQGVAAMVCLGVPDRFPTRLTRRPVEAFVTIDRVDGRALST